MQLNYAQAHPGTPLYDYALLTGLIKDEDAYLTALTDVEPTDPQQAADKGVLLNFSGRPLSEVLSWSTLFQYELKKDKAKKEGFKHLLKLPVNLYQLVVRHMSALSTLGIKLYYERRLKRRVMGYFNLLLVKLKGGNLSSEASIGKLAHLPSIDPTNLTDKRLISRIKRMAYDLRETTKHPYNHYIEQHIDQYGNYSMARYSNLRQINENIRASKPKLEKETRTSDTKERIKSSHIKQYPAHLLKQNNPNGSILI